MIYYRGAAHMSCSVVSNINQPSTIYPLSWSKKHGNKFKLRTHWGKTWCTSTLYLLNVIIKSNITTHVIYKVNRFLRTVHLGKL